MTMNEIARLAGVSRGTVDRVIHNRGNVKPEIQARIQQIIKETGFTPNPAATALRRLSNGFHLGILLPSLHNPFYLDVKEGICSAETQYSKYGVNITLVELQELTPQEQYSAIDRLLNQDIDGLIVPGIDTPEMIAYIDSIAAGMPVVTYNSDLPNSKRLCFIGQHHLQAGRTAGNLLCNSIRRPGVVVPLISYENILAHTQRVEGLRSVLHNAPMEVTMLPALHTAESDEQAYQVVHKLLQTRKDVSCIYVAGGGQVGAADALADSGRGQDVVMICHDLLPRTIEHLKSGVVNFTIGQQPFLQGYLPIAILFDYLAFGKRPNGKFLYTSIDIRIRENADFDGLSTISGTVQI